mgnify:CR=1 FL=1
MFNAITTPTTANAVSEWPDYLGCMEPFLSPNGLFRVEFQGFEMRMSHWVCNPRVTHMPSGRVVLDLWGTMWDGMPTAEADGRLQFSVATNRARDEETLATGQVALAETFVQGAVTSTANDSSVAQTLFADTTLSKLTRLYTVLSPDDMNLDPAFSFNPELPDVPKDHQGTLQSVCPKDGFPNAVLTTASGWKVEIPAASGNTYPTLAVPYAQRVEQIILISKSGGGLSGVSAKLVHRANLVVDVFPAGLPIVRHT